MGSLVRMGPDDIDVALIIVEPTRKSIEAASRAASIVSEGTRVIVVANRVRDEEETELIRTAFEGRELHVIPHDPSIRKADRDGTAPIELPAESPGRAAILSLAERLTT